MPPQVIPYKGKTHSFPESFTEEHIRQALAQIDAEEAKNYKPVSVLRQGRESAATSGSEDEGQGAISRLGQSLAANPMIQGAAAPNELGDILGLTIPNVGIGALTQSLPSAGQIRTGIGQVASAVREPVGRFVSQVGNLVQEANPLGLPVGKPVGQVISRVGGALTDPADYARANRYMGRTGQMPVPVPEVPPTATMRDLYSTWKEPSMPPVTELPPRLVKPGTALPSTPVTVPQLDVVRGGLESLMGSRAVSGRVTAPVPSGGTMTPGGRPSINPAEEQAFLESIGRTQPPAAVPVAPPAPLATPAAPATVAPAAAPVSGPAAAWSPELLRKELGKAMTRANVQLTDEQLQTAAQLMREGHPPVSAVQRVATMSDVRALATHMGSRNAARQLGTTQEAVKTLRGPSQAVLPERARAAIDAKLNTLKGAEAIQAYIDAAPNELAKAYIRFKLGL